MKRFWQGLTLLVFKCLLTCAKVFPLKLMLPVGAALGSIAYTLVSRYRKVALKNLTIAYGDSLSDVEKQGIARRVFQNFAMSAIAEFPYVASLKPEAVKKLVYLDPADYQRLVDVVESGVGIIVVTGHFGNFELCARRFAAEGHRFGVVARIDANGSLAEIFNDIRRKGGYDVIGRGDAVRPIIKRVKEPGVVALLPDQKSEDVFVPFFGTLVGTVAGPAVIALRTGAHVIPVFCVRQPDNTHRIHMLDEIDTSSTGDMQHDVERIMTDYNAVLEKMVRAYPDQWLWLHDRWRSKPPPEVLAKWERARVNPSEGC